MSDHQYKFNVQMGCGGCSSTIQSTFENIDGLRSLDISLERQTVTVFTQSSLSYDAVLAAIKETGKTIHSGEADGVPRSV